MSIDIPVELPEHWEVVFNDAYGHVIEARADDGGLDGAVTVSEQNRNYKLGMMPIREKGPYAGRGWKEKLYRDAVAALEHAIDPEAIRQARKDDLGDQ